MLLLLVAASLMLVPVLLVPVLLVLGPASS